MSELAFSYQGQRFVPPSEAVFWRVRRIRDAQRGQLDVVRDGDGVPLIVPIDISIDDFRTAVDSHAGRYRLDALTEDKLAMRDVPPAYVSVPVQRLTPAAEALGTDRERTTAEGAAAQATVVTAPFGTWPALPMPIGMSGTEYLLAEALRGQVQMFQMLTSALSDRVASNADGASRMIGAAAELVRAADGAAMPRRRPTPEIPVPLIAAATPMTFGVTATEVRNAGSVDQGDVGEGDEVAAAGDGGDEMNGMIAQLGKVMSVIGPTMPHIVSLVRGYPPKADVAHRNVAAVVPEGEDEVEADDDDGDDDNDESAVTPTMVSHMILIAHELGEDGALLRQVLQRMAHDDKRALIDHLCSMSLEDAVADAVAQLAPVKTRMAARSARTCGSSAERDTSPVADDADDSSDAIRTDADGADALEPDVELDHEAPVAATASTARVPSPTDAELKAHMLLIAGHLTFPEMLQAQALIDTVAEPERSAWIQKLTALAPADAAVVVRAELNRRAGS